MRDDDICKTCAYFDPLGPDDAMYGLCRRNAPSPLSLVEEADPYIRATWPKVGETEWCGDYKYESKEGRAPTGHPI